MVCESQKELLTNSRRIYAQKSHQAKRMVDILFFIDGSFRRM
ncbi:unnamed protein product [marine sediment metagenome]|uniref:Uncharacterized protein n=1 Tax=marine sediment metagenome TaxID=412755 RepID=X1SBZ9_9ZZZZ